MILIALGANLPSQHGLPKETLLKALKAIEDAGIEILQNSSIWLTAPVPVSEQPDYHNAVAHVQTALPPKALLKALHSIEADFGRARGMRNEARVLDLDLLAYDDTILNNDEIALPHPRMHQRAFVLGPLAEVAQDWTHPVLKQTLSQLIEKLPKSEKLQIENKRAA